ncbi:DUF4232 domain-containing protein [Streptomyces sp. NPDC048211]|uniref:DUF4232 domain-containing protein n=1 Tax=Streptomyces sp. NPDC048211 TaxID=3365516 RepID=UPI00371236BE
MRSNRIRTTALAATALLAALSLTACSSDNGSGESAKAEAAAPAARTTAKESPSPAAQPDKDATDTATDAHASSAQGNPTAPPAESDGKNTTGTTNRAGSGSGTTSRTPVTCDGKNTRTAVSTVSRPINHLLLTLTNTGSRPCYAYYAPKLRFDDAQAVFPVLDASRPQAVVTLQPGESAYAAIGLTGEPGAGPAPRKATRLQVNFSGRSPEGSTGTPTELTLPSRTYWDDNGFVTYWQTEMADALTY